MDRNDNPGNVEREMDETPIDREGVNDRGVRTDRDSLQGGGVEREGLQGGSGNIDRGVGVDRDSLQGGVEREGLQGGSGNIDRNVGVEREGLQGGSGNIDRETLEGRDNAGAMPATNTDGGTSDQMLRADQREGGYGYDRPVDTTPTRDVDPLERSGGRDRMEGSSRDADTDRSIGDQGRVSRDW